MHKEVDFENQVPEEYLKASGTRMVTAGGACALVLTALAGGPRCMWRPHLTKGPKFSDPAPEWSLFSCRTNPGRPQSGPEVVVSRTKKLPKEDFKRPYLKPNQLPLDEQGCPLLGRQPGPSTRTSSVRSKSMLADRADWLHRVNAQHIPPSPRHYMVEDSKGQWGPSP